MSVGCVRLRILGGVFVRCVMPEKKAAKKAAKKKSVVVNVDRVEMVHWKNLARSFAVELGWSKKDLEKEFGDEEAS